MANDFASILLLVLSFVMTFTAARMLSRWVRRRRGDRDDAARRAAESRQVRRARERRGK
jgi:hypothetical protein